tara:strand:+ start:303 stop:773 length:471 start_codon:yes stop_codon:yes gene_type:complete
MLNSKLIFNLILIFSIFSISFALFLEFVLDYMPCRLCTYQRIPYYLIILTGLINIFNKKYFSYVYLIFALLIFAELLTSGFHSLTTFGIINYTGCESASLPSDITQLKNALLNDSLVVDCSNANLKYLGIPLSLYNFLFSTFFLLLIVLNAYKKKN